MSFFKTKDPQNRNVIIFHNVCLQNSTPRGTASTPKVSVPLALLTSPFSTIYGFVTGTKIRTYGLKTFAFVGYTLAKKAATKKEDWALRIFQRSGNDLYL